MTECPSDERIWACVDGQLSEDDEAALLVHARTCPKCGRAFAEYVALSGLARTFESPDGKDVRLTPSAILRAIVLRKTGERVLLGASDIRWEEEGYEIHIDIGEEGEYEVGLGGDRAEAVFASENFLPSAGQLGAPPDVPSEPNKLFTLKKLNAWKTPSGKIEPAKLRIIFARNVLEGSGNA